MGFLRSSVYVGQWLFQMTDSTVEQTVICVAELQNVNQHNWSELLTHLAIGPFLSMQRQICSEPLNQGLVPGHKLTWASSLEWDLHFITCCENWESRGVSIQASDC